MKKLLVFLCAMLLVLGVTTSNAIALPFGNGSFESGMEIPGDFVTLGVGDSGIDNWEIVNGLIVVASTIDYIGGYWQASDGNRSIDLDGFYTPGAIQQEFDTVPGVPYLVLFDMAGNPDNPVSPIKELQVSAGAYSVDYTFDVTGRSRTDMGWTEMSFTFVAESNSTALMFASLMQGDSAYGPALDNVRVAPVPEPATMLLLGSGLIGLAGLGRKKLFKKA